jgi:hypothetical protein
VWGGIFRRDLALFRLIKRLLAVLLLVVPVDAQALGHGVRILKALKPDVALIQETNYRTNSQADLDTFVRDAFGAGYTIFREPNRPKPNAIVSRYPMVSSGVWEDTAAPDREFVFTRIDIPGPIDLSAVNVHLLTNDGRRGLEASQLSELRSNQCSGGRLPGGGRRPQYGHHAGPCLRCAHAWSASPTRSL